MKVLIVTHNPITSYNSMGKTLLSLFHVFRNEELCQLYIYPTIPDVKKCESYFRITDKEVMKSVIPFRREISDDEISGEQHLYETPSDQNLYRDKAKRKELKLIARQAAWTLGKWHTESLRSWILNEKPDLIFACGGLSSFFYDVILELSRSYTLPVVTYVCDDFYFSTQKWEQGLLQRYYYKLLRNKISQLMSRSCGVVTICDAMSKDYGALFGCKPLTISTGAYGLNSVSHENNVTDRTCGVLRYFGNLKLNRSESLLLIGMALDKLNQEHATHHRLEIYTSDPAPEDFYKVPTIQVKGFVDSHSMVPLVQSAALLVHTESFRQEDIDRVRYSVSTKIAESLWSGIPLFAYGCSEVASIAHLEQNECAFVCNDKDLLTERLYTALYDQTERQRVIRKALITAKDYHDRDNNSNRLYAYLQSVKEENSEVQ